VVEAAAQVSSLRLMAPTDAACAARILAAAASPASAFASTVFVVTCAFGEAAVDEGGEGGCRSCQEGNRRQSAQWRTPPPPMATGRDMRPPAMPVPPSPAIPPAPAIPPLRFFFQTEAMALGPRISQILYWKTEFKGVWK
jgi:hypothetical protein